MTVKTRNLSSIITLALFVGLGMTATAAGAANDCKGLSQSQCDKAGACSWIKGYTTKKGVTVDSYCRAKPKSKTKSDKAKSTSDDTKSSKKKEASKSSDSKGSGTTKKDAKKSSS